MWPGFWLDLLLPWSWETWEPRWSKWSGQVSLTCLSSMGDLTGSDEMVCLTGTGDETRAWGPPFVNSESVYFLSVNRNKKVRRLSYNSHLSYTSYRMYTSTYLGSVSEIGFQNSVWTWTQSCQNLQSLTQSIWKPNTVRHARLQTYVFWICLNLIFVIQEKKGWGSSASYCWFTKSIRSKTELIFFSRQSAASEAAETQVVWN